MKARRLQDILYVEEHISRTYFGICVMYKCKLKPRFYLNSMTRIFLIMNMFENRNKEM